MWSLPREGKQDQRLVDTNTLSEENCFLTACRSLPAAQCWLQVEKAASLHSRVAKGTANVLWHYGQIRRKSSDPVITPGEDQLLWKITVFTQNLLWKHRHSSRTPKWTHIPLEQLFFKSTNLPWSFSPRVKVNSCLFSYRQLESQYCISCRHSSKFRIPLF